MTSTPADIWRRPARSRQHWHPRPRNRFTALTTAAGSMGGVAALTTAVVLGGPTTRALAEPASITVNSARAEGGTRNAFVNLTYTCAQNEADTVSATLRFSWGIVRGEDQDAVCDARPHTLDYKVTTQGNTIDKGEEAEATAELHIGLTRDEVVADSKNLTLSRLA